MTIQELWQEINLRFDPQSPVPLEHPEWRAERTYDPLRKIQAKLSLRSGTPRRILYLGTVGTGKTTELHRLAGELAKRDFVLFVDLLDHFDHVVQDVARLQDVSAWEVCFLIGLMLAPTAAALGGPDDEDPLVELHAAWRAAAQETGTRAPSSDLDLGKLASAALKGAGFILAPLSPVGAIVTQVADAALGGVRWNLPLGASEHPLPEETGKSLLGCVNRIIQRVQAAHRRVVIVIDGLDRLGLDRFGPGRAQSLSRIHKVFIETDLLARLQCPVVICGPFLLRHDPAVLSVRGFEIAVHANEPVLRRDDPSQQGNGVAFFHELYCSRVKDLGAAARRLIPEQELLRLAQFSGGRSRDFVKLIRLSAEEALFKGESAPAQVDTALIDEVLRSARLDMELGIDSKHLDLLREVMADPLHKLPAHDGKVEELLTTGWLLPYPNDSEWYYPHPLLLLGPLKGAVPTVQ